MQPIMSIEDMLNLTTHGALLVVILWQRLDANRRDKQMLALCVRMVDLLDTWEEIVAQSGNSPE